jgi:NitT/TauT family transport system substrate-binding protein
MSSLIGFRARSPRARSLLALPVLGLVVGLLAACGGGSASAPGAIVFADGDPVLQVDTAPYTSVPQTMKYWADQGLNVQVQPTRGSPESIQLLSSGRANIALVGTTALYQGLKTDPSLRLVWAQKANIWRIGSSDANKKSVAELKGATIGVQSLSSGSYLFGRAALAAAGLDPDKDVTWLPVGVAAQAAAALDSGQVTAYASYDGPLDVASNLAKKPLTKLDTPLDQVFGTLAIATTQSYLESNRDDVVKFVRGFNKGALFSTANPEAAMRIHWAVHPDQKPQGDEAEVIGATMPRVQSRFGQLLETGPGQQLGEIDMAELQSSIDFMAEHKLIDQAVDASQILVGDIAPAADDFDHAAVQNQAQQWKP